MHKAFEIWVRQRYGSRYDLTRDCDGFYCREVVKRMFDVWRHCRGLDLVRGGYMSNVIQLAPNEWVCESVLIAVTGLKPGTITRARKESWMLGREYLHISPDGNPKPSSECMYNRKAVDQWIEAQKKNQPGAHRT